MNQLKHVPGRILVKADKEQKNYYTFSNGLTIRLERDVDNLDRSYTQQTFGIVEDAENIPKEAMLLFHFNALHDTYKVFNHSILNGEEIASGVHLYSIPERQCYLWKMAGEPEWNPCKDYAIAERVFLPYNGILKGIEPKKVKDCLFVKTGELAGKIVRTLKACDAALIFRNEKGVDETIIRFRPFGSIEDQREEEAIAIDDYLTDKYYNGEILTGISPSTAKPLQLTAYAD